MANDDLGEFKVVAARFARELQRAGLNPMPGPVHGLGRAGCYGMEIAAWSPSRPVISMWYDYLFGGADEGVGNRFFWFGFEGPARAIARFWKDICSNPQHPKPSAYEQSCQPTLGSLRNHQGFAYEKYSSGYPHFLGIYDLTGATPDVTLAAEFVLRLIDLADQASIAGTEYETTAMGRLGQLQFRRALEDYWESKCAVLEINIPELLRASHIEPWKTSNQKDRIDPDNGLLLSAHLDALFDKHLISFSDDGDLLRTKAVTPEHLRRLNILVGRLSKTPSQKQRHHLKNHRALAKEKWGALIPADR